MLLVNVVCVKDKLNYVSIKFLLSMNILIRSKKNEFGGKVSFL